MNGFSFDATAGSSQSTTKPELSGNNIYEVVFDGCELKDIEGKKDTSALYKVISLKFSNEDGQFEHTIFEPRPEDFQRSESEFTNKNGKVEKIPQPSRVESMMLLFKHILDSLVPEIAAKIDSKEKSLVAPDWDTLRKLIKKMFDAGKGRTIKIKLLKNTKTGKATFPGFFTGISRDNVVYVRNNFIGDKIAFTPYELKRIENEAKASPSNMDDEDLVDQDMGSDDVDIDIDFKVEDL